MPEQEHGLRLWVPNSASTVAPQPTTQTAFTIRTGTEIRVPILPTTLGTTENMRLEQFLSGNWSIFDYYARYLDDQSSTHFIEPRKASENFVSNATTTQECSVPNNVSCDIDNEMNLAPLTPPRQIIMPTQHVNVDTRYASVVEKVIEKLEHMALGHLQNRAEITADHYHGDIRVAAILIRPVLVGGEFQVNFVFGSRNWRRRRSMHTTLVRLTLKQCIDRTQPDKKGYAVSCTCIDYKTSESCTHIKSVVGSDKNRMRTLSFAERRVLPGHTPADLESWTCIDAPTTNSDNVKIWFVYRRMNLSSHFPTSSAVMFDNRESRAMKPLVTRLSCVLCSRNAGRRMKCAHEEALIKSFSQSPPHMSEENNESRELEDGIDELPTLNHNDGVSYVSKMPRSVFACISEERTLMNIIKISSGESVDDSIEIGVDDEVYCSNSEIDLKEGGNGISHVEKCVLHTLHHGSIPYLVTEFTCSNCGLRVFYDGLCHGVFRLNKTHLFSRELLDMWLWDICGTGGTFRDAYSSWSSKSYAATASLHRIGTDNFASRQLSNEAFTSFLKTLRFTREGDLFELFSCPDCEKRDADGNRYFDGIVMDGTALGILRTLPNFIRQAEIVSAVTRVPDRQYLIREPKIRSFIDSLLVAAKSSNEDGLFSVSLKLSLWQKRHSLIERLLTNSVEQTDETSLAGCLLTACFRVRNSGSQIELDNANSDDELVEAPGKLAISFIIRDIDVRRTIIDFGRCFLSGSVAGGALRDTKSLAAATYLAAEFIRFSSCVHENDKVCLACREKLLTAGYSYEELIPAGGRLAVAISTAGSGSEFAALKCLARVTGLLIQRCMLIRERYHSLFFQNQSEAVRTYSHNHRLGNGLPGTQCLDWLSEAQRTGEFFPGREDRKSVV